MKLGERIITTNENTVIFCRIMREDIGMLGVYKPHSSMSVFFSRLKDLKRSNMFKFDVIEHLGLR